MSSRLLRSVAQSQRLRDVVKKVPGVALIRHSPLIEDLRLSTRRTPEDVWHKPRADCEHPEYWHATDGDSTELEVTDLLVGFVRGLQPDFVIETGTAYGQAAKAMGHALKENGHGRLLTLEPDPDRARLSRYRCRRLPVTIVQKSSMEYTPDAVIDFAWFDSLIELRTLEFRRYWPYMHSGTVVGFHDTGPAFPLRRCIDELAVEDLLTPPLHLATPRGVTFAVVCGRPGRQELALTPP